MPRKKNKRKAIQKLKRKLEGGNVRLPTTRELMLPHREPEILTDAGMAIAMMAASLKIKTR